MATVSDADRASLHAAFVPLDLNTPSQMYSMLPVVVRNRIPQITHIGRRSMEVMRAAGRSSRPASQEFDTPPFTPTPENADRQLHFAAQNGEMPSTYSPEPERSVADFELEQLVATRPGDVNWNTAHAGIQLWMAARQQVGQVNADPARLRAMHIDATRYMQMALPTDLTMHETIWIQNSLPEVLRGPLQDGTITGNGQGGQKYNRLRQGVSQMTYSLITLLLFFMPFIVALCRRVARFERENQVTEKVLSRTIHVVDFCGDRAIYIRRELSRFSQGRVGGWLAEVGFWMLNTLICTLNSIVGGVNDGLVKRARAGLVVQQS